MTVPPADQNDDAPRLRLPSVAMRLILGVAGIVLLAIVLTDGLSLAALMRGVGMSVLVFFAERRAVIYLVSRRGLTPEVEHLVRLVVFGIGVVLPFILYAIFADFSISIGASLLPAALFIMTTLA